MTSQSPTYGGMKSIGGNGSIHKNSNNLFAEIHRHWGLLPGNKGLNNINEETQTTGSNVSPLDNVKKQAEIIAADVIASFDVENEKKCPDRFCKAMRKTVKEVSERHAIALKSMVNKLNVDDTNMFVTFNCVADEIFEDGQINWGRVIVVYAFASRLAAYFRKSNPEIEHKIALFVGKYVGNKLGRWILENGGWDAFADFFSNENAVEDQIWKGLLFTATLGGLGALAAVMSR